MLLQYENMRKRAFFPFFLAFNFETVEFREKLDEYKTFVMKFYVSYLGY